MVLISCHPLGRTQPVMCSLLSSTLPPPTWDHPWGTSRLRLQTPTPIKSCGGYDFFSPLLHKRPCPHTSSLWLLFPTHLLPPLPSPPPPPSWIFFGDPASKRCVPFIPVCGLSHVALLDPICVVCSQTGAARAKCQAPSCCLHLPQWPAQCPSLCPTLNPTARPLTADSPRPHLRVSDPRRDRSEKKNAPREKNETKQRAAIWESPPCPVKRPPPFVLQGRAIAPVNGTSPLPKTPLGGLPNEAERSLWSSAEKVPGHLVEE